MIYMPGGRSLVNNSIFNLVLMLAGFSPTSASPLPSILIRLSPSFGSLYFTFSCHHRRFRPARLFFSLLLFPLFLSFYSSALIPPCRRPDKGEISTSVNKFLHPSPSLPRTFHVRASRNQKQWNSAKRKNRQISLL